MSPPKRKGVLSEDLNDKALKLKRELAETEKKIKKDAHAHQKVVVEKIAEKFGGTLELFNTPESVKYNNESRLDFGRGPYSGMYFIIRLPGPKVRRIGFGYPECREGFQCGWYITDQEKATPDLPLFRESDGGAVAFDCQSMLPESVFDQLEFLQHKLKYVLGPGGSYFEQYTKLVRKEVKTYKYEYEPRNWDDTELKNEKLEEEWKKFGVEFPN
jgi:hypothetical protein